MGVDHVTLILTNECNLRCPFCFQDSGLPEPEEISVSDLLKGLSRLNNLRSIRITGGEPMLPKYREKLLTILDWAIWKRLIIQVNTNGTQHNLDGIDPKYVHFQVSIDGYQERHNMLRGQGVYEKAVKFIDLLKSSGFKVHIMTVITDDNWNEVARTLNELMKIGVPIQAQFVNKAGRGRKFVEGRAIDRDLIEYRIKRYYKSVQLRPYINKCSYHLNYIGNYNILGIDASGNVIPCPALKTYKFGHILEFNEERVRAEIQRMITNRGLTCCKIT